jgi:hypothetical protein
MTKNLKKLQLKINKKFGIKIYNLRIRRPSERTSKSQPSALKREHPALQNMIFLIFFLFEWVIFALLDPSPMRIHLHDPKQWFILSIFPS